LKGERPNYGGVLAKTKIKFHFRVLFNVIVHLNQVFKLKEVNEK